MKIVGIIAEYNPFHNGHAYQLQRAKELTGADFAVIVMSPDFVQRGEPALTDKYKRAEMALASGADLVLELPVCYACGSAEYFAEGAVALLHSLGCVDVLSFGCETKVPELFAPLAQLLLQEPEEYREKLLEYQKQGMTYPLAREKAVTDYLGGKGTAPEAVLELLSSPNNILGLEYVKALKKINSPIATLPIRRLGSGYHSLALDQQFCSASAVRSRLTGKCALRELAPFLPESSLSLLQETALEAGFVTLEQFSSLLHFKLLSEADAGFCRYLDVTPDLSDRIRRILPQYRCISQFISLVKTKQMTEARVRRAFLHILLNITGEATERYRGQGTVFYARILGFRRAASPLLQAIKKQGSIPLLSKLADAKKLLDAPALQMLAQDIYASHLYQLPASGDRKAPIRSEYTCSPVMR